ncbi:hypothetical protein [Mucilaginibacter arboris]|nr:hypothetical protein [Mucilaginibacter arboris]
MSFEIFVSKENVFLAEIFIKSESETIDEDAMIKRLTEQGYIE